MTTLTTADLVNIVAEAQREAFAAANTFFQDKLNGVDQFACGFAWVDLYQFDGKKIRGNSKIGKALKEAGVRQDYTRTFQLWNPSKFPCQNVDTLEVGARAAADVFKKYGFVAYAGSRLD